MGRNPALVPETDRRFGGGRSETGDCQLEARGNPIWRSTHEGTKQRTQRHLLFNRRHCCGLAAGRDPSRAERRGRLPLRNPGVYAGHPTIVNELVLHADWPGAAARRFEARTNRTTLPTVGIMWEGALGNVSISGLDGATDQDKAENTGAAIADRLLDDAATGKLLDSNELLTASTPLVHPITTNPGLVTISSVGLFDRETTPLTPGAGPPCSYYWSKQGEDSDCPGEDPDDVPNDTQFLRGCSSSGPSVITVAGAHRIGEIVIAFAPGEIFSTLGEVIRERADRTAMTTVLGQTNDALGYIVQSFEYDMQGNVVTEYGTGTGEYEEVFATDRCLGDHVLETILESTEALGAGR